MLWVPEGRGAATKERADAAGLTGVALAEIVTRSDVDCIDHVISGSKGEAIGRHNVKYNEPERRVRRELAPDLLRKLESLEHEIQEMKAANAA